MNIIISIVSVGIGGGEILPIMLANRLSAMNHNVTLHVLGKCTEEKVEERIDKNVKLLYTGDYLKFVKYVYDNSIDVINTHNQANQNWLNKIMWLLKARHVATVHGMFEAMPLSDAARIINKFDRHVYKWIYVAENSHETLMQSGVNCEKMLKIENSVEKPDKIVSIDLSEYNIPHDAVTVCVISRAVGKKCWPECIETITRAREKSGLDIHLILAGRGEIYDKLVNERLPEYIHLIGAVSDPYSLYAASDIGMLLSIRECAPLALIEMYYAGVPAIATDTGDIRKMMTTADGKMTGILLPLRQNVSAQIDVEKASDAVVQMLTDTQMYQQFKDNAQSKAADFDVDKMAVQYLEAYGQ